MRIFLSFIFIALLISPAGAVEVFPFKGEVDLAEKTLVVQSARPGDSAWEMTVRQDTQDVFRMLLSMQHMDFRFFEVSTNLEGVLQPAPSDDGERFSWAVELKSRYSLVNRRPVKEVHAEFSVGDGVIGIRRFVLGNLEFSGNVEIHPPFRTDLAVELSEVDMEDFLLLLNQDQPLDAEGKITGAIHLKGVPGRFMITSRLQSGGGHFKNREYDSIDLSLEGIYPVMQITSLKVSRPEGFAFEAIGRIDLSRRDTLMEQIGDLTSLPMTRSEGRNAEWTLKRIESGSGTTELKYLFREDVGRSQDAEVDLFGVERKMEF